MLINFININGLAGKIEEIKRFNNTNNITLTILVETWLSPNASVPFRPYIQNITATNPDLTAKGGRRNNGGILIFSPSNTFAPHNALLYTHPAGCFSVLNIQNIIVIATYISPAQPNTMIDELLAKAEHYSDGFSKRCVIIGDLNARMHRDTGDSTDNTRGKLLRQALLNSALSLQTPQQGKWTTWSGTGCGITDIVLSNFDINTLTVHEGESLGGSDHRPLTLELPINSDNYIPKEFNRINIRKLEIPDNRVAFRELLQEPHEHLLDGLRWLQSTSGLSPNQEIIDEAWEHVKCWLLSAAHIGLGTISVHDHITEDFWTEELEDLRDKTILQQAELQESILDTSSTIPQATVVSKAKSLTEWRRTYRVAIQARRRELFRESADNLSSTSNLSAFFRRVKCARARQLKSHCMLDPELIDTHALHFRNTFGGPPTGTLGWNNVANGTGDPPTRELANALQDMGEAGPSRRIFGAQPVPPASPDVSYDPFMSHTAYSHPSPQTGQPLTGESHPIGNHQDHTLARTNMANGTGDPPTSELANAFQDMGEAGPSRRISGAQPVPPASPDVSYDPFMSQRAYSHLSTQTGQTPSSEFSLTDIQRAIKDLPRGKAAGPDGIPAELLTSGGIAVATAYELLLNMIYQLSCIPSEWRSALIVPVYKNKGSDKEIANYRPIALTCTSRRLYERLLIPAVGQGQSLLHDAQAGFRERRSTLDQAMILHESLQSNNNAFAILLDLKAAYDLVDRRILWHQLSNCFNFPPTLVQRLQDLFDYNQSELVIAGNRSHPIRNTRGLLQGSSLSPMLFNYFIDSLCQKLNAPGVPKIMTHGTLINSLLFADDTSLLACNLPNMAKLLTICEEWSQSVGMVFSPSKCVVLGPTPETRSTPLRLYNTDLPSAEIAPYLGFPFRHRGICWKSLAKARTDKARGVIAMFAPMGFNAKGWAPSVSVRIYKAFIRPVMEYGLALLRPTPSILAAYEKVQSLALRTLTSAPRNTSRTALLRLLQIESIEHRALDLNIMWAGRLFNSSDASNLAVKVFHRAIQGNRGTLGISLPRHAVENPLWSHPEANAIAVPLTRPGHQPLPPVPKILDQDMRIELRRKSIIQHDNNAPNVAGAIQLELDDIIPPFLHPKAGIDRDDRWLLLQWRLGAVTRHETCQNCGDTLTRAHAASCSGATTFLEEHHPEVPPAAHSRHTLIDAVLNNYRQQSPKDGPAHFNCARAIQLILEKCRGLRHQENGQWASDDATQPSQTINTAPPARTAASHRQSARNARERVERNRPLGRPRKRREGEMMEGEQEGELGARPKRTNIGGAGGPRTVAGVG